MKWFVIEYESRGTAYTGRKVIEAESRKLAIKAFLEWVIEHPSFSLLWQLSFEIKEADTL